MIHVKRYALFAFPLHDAEGGWGDFKGLFDTVEEAQQGLAPDQYNETCATVVDLLTLEVVSMLGPRRKYGDNAGKWHI